MTKAEVCVVYLRQRLRQITQTEALLIFYILGEPNLLNRIINCLIIYLYLYQTPGERLHCKQNLSFGRHLYFSAFGISQK